MVIQWSSVFRECLGVCPLLLRKHLTIHETWFLACGATRFYQINDHTSIIQCKMLNFGISSKILNFPTRTSIHLLADVLIFQRFYPCWSWLDLYQCTRWKVGRQIPMILLWLQLNPRVWICRTIYLKDDEGMPQASNRVIGCIARNLASASLLPTNKVTEAVKGSTAKIWRCLFALLHWDTFVTDTLITWHDDMSLFQVAKVNLETSLQQFIPF